MCCVLNRFALIFLLTCCCCSISRGAQLRSPCPKVFRYVEENGDLVGYLQILYPVQRRNTVLVEYMLVSEYEEEGTLTHHESISEIIDNIKIKKPIHYRLEFPTWNKVAQPKVTKIYENNRLICEDNPLSIYPGLTTRTIVQHNTFTISGPLETEVVHRPPPPKKRPGTTNVQPVTDNYESVASLFDNKGSSSITIGQRRPSGTVDQSCGYSNDVNFLVVGGNDSPRGRYPWLAPIYARKHPLAPWTYKCVANLVSNRHLLTAAHCTETNGVSIDPKNMLVALGLYDLKRFPTDDHEVNIRPKQIRVHRDYRFGKGDADVAVIVLERSVEFSFQIKPICLWSESFGGGVERFVGKEGVVAGWGRDGSADLSDVPKETYLPFVTVTQCVQSHSNLAALISDRTFCAGDRNNVGPCQGDSGAGFMMAIGSQYFIRGLVSVSLRNQRTGYCDLSNYVVFADVAALRPFIEKAMSDL